MPFALLFIGLILVIAGARGTLPQLGALLKSEFTGAGNFFYWLLAIGVVGAIGYKSKGEAFSRSFMTLILISMVLSNKGIFNKFMDAVGNISATEAGAGTAAGNTIDAKAAPQKAGTQPQATGKVGEKIAAGQQGLAGIQGTLNDISSLTQGLNNFMGGSSGGASGVVGSLNQVGGFVNKIGGFVGMIGKIGGFLGGLF